MTVPNWDALEAQTVSWPKGISSREEEEEIVAINLIGIIIMALVFGRTKKY